MRINAEGWIVFEPQDPAWLGIERIPTERTRPLEPRGRKPRGICWHYTEVCSDMRALCKRIVPLTVRDEKGKIVSRKASWHALIARDGTIYQCAPFVVGTWHVSGPPAGKLLDGRSVNSQTIGVEVENWGRLKRDSEGRWWKDSGDKVAERAWRLVDEDTTYLNGHFWHTFDPLQIEVAQLLTRSVASWAGRCEAFEHSKLQPGDKLDPGPLWPLAALRALELPAEAP